MINPDRVDMIADALESGTYAKGTGKLHAISPEGRETWCCLGVASQVAAQNGLSLTREIISDDFGSSSEIFDEHDDETLCPAVQEWFGFHSDNPGLPGPAGSLQGAAEWNDRGPANPPGHPASPEPDFTTIAAAFRELAADAREKS